MDILTTVGKHYRDYTLHYPVMLERAKRYAQLQEMAIMPDGTFMPHGRSITYRMGAFHHLACMALKDLLPQEVSPEKARCALTSVIKRCMEHPSTYDEGGWLRIGLFGHQPNLGEAYIATGSLYLCSTAYLPLGLSPSHPFWYRPDVATTMERIISGENVEKDHAF